MTTAFYLEGNLASGQNVKVQSVKSSFEGCCSMFIFCYNNISVVIDVLIMEFDHRFKVYMH